MTFAEKDIGDADCSKIQNKDSLQAFCDLLKVDLEAVAHVMIFREMTTRGETYVDRGTRIRLKRQILSLQAKYMRQSMLFV